MKFFDLQQGDLGPKIRHSALATRRKFLNGPNALNTFFEIPTWCPLQFYIHFQGFQGSFEIHSILAFKHVS